MDTGFNWYHDADPGRVRPDRRQLGRRARAAARARREAHRGCVLGRRPRVLPARTTSRRRRTSTSTGTATSSGASGCRRSSASRRALLPDVDFSLGGRDFRGDIGNGAPLRRGADEPVRTRDLRGAHQPVHHAPRARLRLRLVVVPAVRARVDRRRDRRQPVRRDRALVRARLGALVVSTTEQAVDVYRQLLDDPAQAAELGRRARERVLDEHTYRHRARQLLELIGLREEARVG